MAYLLCQSMAVADRRRHERTIVGRWHDALVRRGVTEYSFADAVEDYMRSALVCLGWAVAGAALERPNQRARRVARVQALRNFTAVADMGPESLSLLP